jgi:hypothetical protein
MQKAKGSWTKIATLTAILCCCLGIAYGTNAHSSGLPFPKLEALMAAKKIEHIVITNGDPCVGVKIKGRTIEESTYVDRTEDRMALIRQSTQANGIEIWLH